MYIPDGDETEASDVCDASDMLQALLDVEPTDPESAAGFMRLYGLARSPARVILNVGEFDAYTPDSLWCNVAPDTYMTRYAMEYTLGAHERFGIYQTARLYQAVLDSIRDGRPPAREMHDAVSVAEAHEAVRMARAVASTICDAKKEGRFPVGVSSEALNAQEKLALACEYASRALAPYTPAIAPFTAFTGYVPPAYAPPLIVALAEVARVALDAEPLKQCKQCGRWFQYKRPGQRGYPIQNPDAPLRKRERGSDYCSDDCYRDHKNAARKKQRDAARDATGADSGPSDE